MLLTALRAIALLICFVGYFLLLRKKGLPVALAPVVTFSGIGSILFLAGILNLLPHATIALFLAGIFCFISCKPWKSGELSKNDIICMIAFFVLTALFCLRIRGNYPLHYDAFSHWMTVIHDTLNNDHFPNYASEMISFQSYQTGAAGFAYFICRIVGSRADDVILMTQALPVAAALCVFGAFIRRLDICSLLTVLLGGLYCIVASPTENLSLCEPLPDTLVSMLSIAGLAVIVHYRRELTKALWWSLPIQIFLVSVKNSGVFMLVFNSLLLAYYLWQQDKNRFRKTVWKPLLIHCGVPFGIFFLWNRHVDYMFQYGTLTKHALSLDYYRGTLGAKSLQEILDTMILYLRRFFSPNPSWLLLLLCIALFGGVYLYKTKVLRQDGKNALVTLAGIVAAYAAYMVGLAAMYLLSMSSAEAAYLAGYDRYEETVIIYLVGAIVIYLLEFFHTFEKQPLSIKCLGTAAIALILLTQTGRIPLLIQDSQAYEGSSRQILERLKEEYAIPDGASCLIYGEQIADDSGYHDGLCRYVFWSTKTDTCAPPATSIASVDTYDYLILLSSDESMDQFLTEKGLTPGEAVYILNPTE